MDSNQERADTYLTHWAQHMAGECRLNVVRWLAAGSVENESMVVHHLLHMEQDMLERWPKIDSCIYTNCKDVLGWSNSFVVNVKATIGTVTPHVFQKGPPVANAMYYEEGLVADLYVANGLPPALTLYGLGLGHYNYPLPPVVAVFPMVPDELWSYTPPKQATDMFRYMGSLSTFWCYVVDNQREVELIENLMKKAGHPDYDRTRKVRTYRWPKVQFPEKRDVVVWSGRRGTLKNQDLGAQVFSLLPNVEKEVFFPRVGSGSERFVRTDTLTMHAGEPPDIYRQLTAAAKVLLITSFSEAGPAGYFELMGQGCLPVVWKRPWTKDVLPPDWPLLFDTPGEGAEMILEAMRNYERYAPVLWDWMGQRFGQPLNFADLIQETWDRYVLELGDRIRLVAARGVRRGL